MCWHKTKLYGQGGAEAPPCFLFQGEVFSKVDKVISTFFYYRRRGSLLRRLQYEPNADV